MNDPRCGTYAGYKVHRRRGEEACQPCLAANAERTREWVRETGYKHPPRTYEDRREYLRPYMAARSRALSRLGQEHPERLQQLLAEERGVRKAVER